jgi:phage replication O-like protein O
MGNLSDDRRSLKKILRQVLKRVQRAGCDVDPAMSNILASSLPSPDCPTITLGTRTARPITPDRLQALLQEIDSKGEFPTREEAQKFLDLLGVIFWGVELRASPQVENGYIRISNEIAEAFERLHITGNQWKILWAILRKTYGWHKKMDYISISQFERLTGLKRRHVSRTISDLVARNIVTKNGDTFITNYAFQKDYTQWETITKRGDKKHTVTILGTRPSPKMVHTKDIIQKKSNGRASKKDVDPRIKDFFDYWGESFSRETGQPYTFSYGKDGRLVKDLLKVHSPEILREVTKSFFQDEQCKRRGLTIGILFQEINRLLGAKAMNPLEQAKREQRAREVVTA